MQEELLSVVGDHPQQALLVPSTSRDFEAVVDAIASLLTLRTFRISLKMQAKVRFRTQFRIHKKQQGSKNKASGSARPSGDKMASAIYPKK